MNELELANRFDRQRLQLRAVAYRILGSVSEADDAVQDAWLRLRRTDAEQLDSLERWLTTVVARICLNMLRSRRTRAEQPLESLRPEPIITDPEVGTDPEHEALLADSVGIALQVVLDTLSPAERLAFVLHDISAVPFTGTLSIGRGNMLFRRTDSRLLPAPCPVAALAGAGSEAGTSDGSSSPSSVPASDASGQGLRDDAALATVSSRLSKMTLLTSTKMRNSTNPMRSRTSPNEAMTPPRPKP